MGGPALSVSLTAAVTDESLDAIDTVFEQHCSRVERTRKGRVWSLWIGAQPYYARVDVDETSQNRVWIDAGCNSREDYENLRILAKAICDTVGGMSSEPTK